MGRGQGLNQGVKATSRASSKPANLTAPVRGEYRRLCGVTSRCMSPLRWHLVRVRVRVRVRVGVRVMVRVGVRVGVGVGAA